VDDESKLERVQRLSSLFTPSAPVNRRDHFQGRFDEIVQVTSALRQPGRHVVLYGERGVGKTSLANLLTEFLFPTDRGNPAPSVRVNCTTQDTYKTVWTKIFRQLKINIPEAWAYTSPDPDEIRVLLAELELPAVVILDEFDRMEDDESLSLMADTIKGLSDHVVETRIVIVGVADSIDQLIGEHESVRRAIEEVLMARMSQDELIRIIDNGLENARMTIQPRARMRISRLSEGLPHYVHLLALYAAQGALQDDRMNVSLDDVSRATEAATRNSHSLLKEYQLAIQSPRRNNLFARVLTSCALADKNPLGQFTARAVREPMSRIMGSPYDIPSFAAHLKSFTEIDRGCVLRREGTKRRYFYRFQNPLLQPYTLLTAIAEGFLPTDYMNEILDGEPRQVS
jgi:Cdc6-like AAA superfamily ATPase